MLKSINVFYKNVLLKSFKKHKSDVIKISYQQLTGNNDISEYIDKAYGRDGLGLIVIKDIPEFLPKREKALINGFQLANMPKSYLQTLEKPETHYYTGWSQGRQYLDDGHDYMQAMFYARTYTDYPIYKEDPDVERKYTNIWPDSITNFKTDYLRLGITLGDCQINLLKHLDKYIESKIPTYEKGFLYNNFSKVNDAVGMMATYYPSDMFDHNKFKGKPDNWCGWHRDFGLLSGLCRPMFLKRNGDVVKVDTSGLIIRDRAGNLNELNWEEDEIVIQAADALFVYSAGSVISTPHAVKITDSIPKDVFRMNFVSFFEPNWSARLRGPGNMTIKEIIEKDPFQMSNVITKLKEDMIYKQFIMETFENFVKS